MFKVCFSSGVDRDEEAGKGAKTYDIFQEEGGGDADQNEG